MVSVVEVKFDLISDLVVAYVRQPEKPLSFLTTVTEGRNLILLSFAT